MPFLYIANASGYLSNETRDKKTGSKECDKKYGRYQGLQPAGLYQVPSDEFYRRPLLLLLKKYIRKLNSLFFLEIACNF